jgi:hypothetical protein
MSTLSGLIPLRSRAPRGSKIIQDGPPRRRFQATPGGLSHLGAPMGDRGCRSRPRREGVFRTTGCPRTRPATPARCRKYLAPWLCAGQTASHPFLAATSDEAIAYVSDEVLTSGAGVPRGSTPRSCSRI